MKKVLLLVPSLGMGGMERVLVNYANLFAKRGYAVTVLNLSYDDPAIVSGFDPAVRYVAGFSPVKHLLLSSARDILHFRFRILPWRKWFRLHSSQYLYKKYVREDFDVEIAFFGVETFKIISGSINQKACKLGWIHSSNSKQFGSQYVKAADIPRIYRKIENIVCVSQESKKLIQDTFGERSNVFVINNPNDSEKIRKQAQEPCEAQKNAFTFVNVSRIDDTSKGFFRLLDVCKRLREAGFVFSLWIIGNGADYEAVKRKIEKDGLTNVVLFGQQSNPYKFMKQADMYLCSSYYEGFSMTMAEAVILAKPILTTRVSGADEMLDGGKYGLIVENSEEGLLAGMTKILSDENLFRHYCTMAELRKDYLSEKSIMDKVESVIDNET